MDYLNRSFTHFNAFLYKNWIMARRNFFTIFEMMFWPFYALISIGLMTLFLELSPEKVAFVLIGTIALSTIQICQIDIAYVLLLDVWSKSIKQTLLAPVDALHLSLGGWFVGIIRGLLVFVFLSLFSYFAFGFDFLRPGILRLTIFLFGLFIMGAIVGNIVCILLLLFGQRAEVAAWSLAGLFMLICGIYYPSSILPAPLFYLSQLIPLTYFLDYFRVFYGIGKVIPFHILKGYFLLVVYFAGSILGYELCLRKAKRSGMLLRLSE